MGGENVKAYEVTAGPGLDIFEEHVNFDMR
jgi:hypothetical protein